MKKHGAVLLSAMFLALPCAAIADPVLGVPVTPTTNQGPPIVINECRLMTSGNQLVTTSSGIQIQFTNETTKTAQLINFQVNDVYQNAVIRDVGTFSPGITVIHKYKIGAGETYSPLFDAPNLRCSVSSIKFDDGSVWHSDQPPLSVTSFNQRRISRLSKPLVLQLDGSPARSLFHSSRQRGRIDCAVQFVRKNRSGVRDRLLHLRVRFPSKAGTTGLLHHNPAR